MWTDVLQLKLERTVENTIILNRLKNEILSDKQWNPVRPLIGCRPAPSHQTIQSRRETRDTSKAREKSCRNRRETRKEEVGNKRMSMIDFFVATGGW